MKSKSSQPGKRRAQSIHDQIETLKRGAAQVPAEAETSAGFVHRRMRELAEQERQKASKKALRKKSG